MEHGTWRTCAFNFVATRGIAQLPPPCPSFQERCKMQKGTWKGQDAGGPRKAKVEEGQNGQAWRKGHGGRQRLQQEGHVDEGTRRTPAPNLRAIVRRHGTAAHVETPEPLQGGGRQRGTRRTAVWQSNIFATRSSAPHLGKPRVLCFSKG